MNLRVRGRSRVIDVLLIAALAVAGPIPAFATETHLFDVPAEDAPSAIRDFASQAHVQILVAGENVREKRLHPVAGELSTEEGLRLLLADSGLSPQYVGDRSIALVKASDANSPSQGIAKEGKNSSSGEFRLAQMDQGANSQSSAVGSNVSGTQENVNKSGLEEITVTAQKKSERLQDVPVPVTVIAAQTLIDNNQLRLQDYYTSVPGLNLSTDAYGAPAISIRGITTGGFTNPTVGIVVDDVPYGSSSSHGYGQEILGVDPTDLASVEVLRGPQGTLYGASSLGGLIKYVTVEPSPEAFSGQVGAGLTDVYNGAEPGYNFSGSVNLPITDTLALRVSGYTHQDAGYIDDPALNLKGVNEGWADGGHVAALWRPSQDFSLKLSALVQYDKMNGVSEADVAPGLGVLQQNDIPGSGASNRALEAYTATIRANLGTVALTSLSGYTSLRNTQYDDYTNALSTFTQSNFGVAGTVIYESNPTDKVSQEIRFASTFGQWIDWLVGGFYTHEYSHEIEDLFAENPTTAAYVGTGLHDDLPYTFSEYAVFADLTLHVTDRFDVQIGGRESHNTQTYIESYSGPFVPTFFGAPSPLVYPEAHSNDSSSTYLLAPQFKISSDLMVYARLSSGYRPGGPNITPGESNLPATFGPDKTQNYEIGVKGDAFGRALTFDGSLYYIDWKNIQIQVEDPHTGFDYNTNGSTAKSQGVELSMDSRPLQDLTIGAWVAWNDAVLTRAFPATSTAYGTPGDRLPFDSRISGRLSIEQDFPLVNDLKGFAGGAVSYVGDRTGVFTSSSQRQDFPAYAQSDLSAGVKGKSWKANLFVTNIADKRGILNGGLGNLNPAAFEYIQPRTVGLYISESF